MNRGVQRILSGGGARFFFLELKVLTSNERRRFWEKTKINFAKILCALGEGEQICVQLIMLPYTVNDNVTPVQSITVTPAK